jgi:Domain of unknown function (DUF4382)
MKKVKKWMAAIGVLMLMVMLVVSCQKEQTVGEEVPAGMKRIKVFLTDDPSLVFDSIFVDIRVLEVKVETNTGSEFWDTLPIRTGVYNILKFRNGVDTLLTTAYIPNGEVKKIRLTLGTQNSVMKNGNSFPLALHNNNRQVIIDIPDVDSIDPNTFAIWIDFDGHGSVIRLRDNVFELRPRIHTFSNSHGARIEGEIKPRAALPAIVKVIAGSDTLLAVTDNDDGKFKIRGIRSSTVKLMVIPSNGYRDSVLNNIQLSAGRDTKLGDIVVRQ